MQKRRTLLVLFFTLLVDAIGVGMLVPLIPTLFTDPTSPAFVLLGYSTDMQYLIAGVITALFGVVQFLAAPILGQLSDTYGRKRLLMIGVGVLAFSQIAFGIGVELAALWLLFAARAIAGLAAANFSIAQAAIADISLPEERSRNFGLIGGAFGLAFIIGPMLGGFVAGVTGDAAMPFWIAGALGILNLGFVYAFLPETRPTVQQDPELHPFRGFENIVAAWRDPDARPVYLASFLYMAGFAFLTSFFGILLAGGYKLSVTDVGIFFSIVGLWVVFTQLVLLRIVSHFVSEYTILRYALPVVAVALILQPFMPSVLSLYVLMPLFSIPHSLAVPSITALVSKGVSRERQGAALGINASLMAFSQGTVPVLAGVASGILGLIAPFVAGGIFVAAAWCVLFLRVDTPA